MGVRKRILDKFVRPSEAQIDVELLKKECEGLEKNEGRFKDLPIKETRRRAGARVSEEAICVQRNRARWSKIRPPKK